MAEPDSALELEGLLPLVADDGRIRRLLTPTKNRQATRKHRQKFLDSLCHQPPFPDRYVTALSLDQSSSAQRIAAALRARGAPNECYVITEGERDGTTTRLEDALRWTRGGTILLCIPGRLAYYVSEDESDQWIVERRDTRASNPAR